MSNASPNAPPTPALFSQYRKGEGVYDELYDASGLRGAWRPFVQAIESLGVEGFKRRWQQANRALNRNGLAYSSWKENEKEARPWELDPIPLLIPSEDWDVAVKGLQQRARLLEAILTDIYGHQELMKSNVLPPEVVFSHPGFCRPFHRQRPPANHFLHFYAADMARAPNGKWWVLADRTEAPSGAGFVLENRLIQSRTLPTIFHQANVQRLAQYFLAFKRAVAAAAPRVENPRVVILSQGSGGPNYFEDAYLARYLGYTLVEASDLAIRNHRVMLKTLGGLIQVDVIIRRPNSEQCDSLELSHTSEGVPGLLQASRNGNVAVINPLGSGLVESPIFMAFMPKLCQELFGEPLLTPGVATWWCGDPDQMDHVLANLDTLIVKRAYRMRGRELAFANMVRNQSREATIKMIRSDPHQYVGQEVVKRSTCPVWKSQGIAPAPIAMRAFAVASGDDFEVMQGGLVRVSAAPDPLEMSILAGEKSKDAWVLSQGPVNRVSLLKKAGGPIDLKRTGGELPSRVAENLFWLGRNLERADVCARLLRATIVRLTSESILEEQPETPALLRALADIGQIETGYGIEEIRKQLPPLETALPPAVFDASDSFSLRAIVTEIFRLTTRSRDRVSSDSWRILHRIDKSFTPPAIGQWDLSDLLALLDDLILDLAAFSGIVSESMTRTQIYYFLDMGRRIERALQQVRLLRNCLIEPTGDLTAILEALLEISDSSMTYRSRYLADVQMPAVLDLLLTDETNPRSIARQLVQLLDHVNALPHNTGSGLFSLEQRLAMTLLNETRMCDVTVFRESEDLNPNAPLSLLLQEIESLLPKLADALSNRYLVHAGAQVQLTEIRP
ncbi:circularly permuted type 2 ATP-grasp protein [Blastopirellula sp. J2-11]|uniref:circularly permuted type 2 ATP-grasp protein n=1 Tax=Blastopirellula sp. J2-11 TaxID=2943192 RepID=UPI0021C90DB7|nr:circularly permuted type 2 ATP-grasp protein [Blastopirellula sp. J2-11]UUO08322.1 circularly permuted type 2 ATP-grasp protein [Blastopirellula sp. J2-11]